MPHKLKDLNKTKYIYQAAKQRTNEVSGMLCGKTLFFSHFFQKSGQGLGQSPINSSQILLTREYCRRSHRLCAVKFMPHKLKDLNKTK